MPTVNIDEDKCTGCKTCEEICPMEVFTVQDRKAKVTNADKCIGCRACEAQCPEHCITVND